MLKVELHTHTADDPADLIPHTTADLIDRAAATGYGALAVTLHDHQLDLRPWADYARERGIVLIPGVERTIQGKHVLLLNFPAVADTVTTFDEVRRLKERFLGLVVAPHPFYPSGSCLHRRLMDQHADVFDAVEFTYFHTRATSVFNVQAVRWAAAHRVPLVGNGDVHRLSQLGKTYSLVDAEPSVQSILEAIRNGRVEVVTEPLPAGEAASYMRSLVWARWKKAWRGQPATAEPWATNEE